MRGDDGDVLHPLANPCVCVCVGCVRVCLYSSKAGETGWALLLPIMAGIVTHAAVGICLLIVFVDCVSRIKEQVERENLLALNFPVLIIFFLLLEHRMIVAKVPPLCSPSKLLYRLRVMRNICFILVNRCVFCRDMRRSFPRQLRTPTAVIFLTDKGWR